MDDFTEKIVYAKTNDSLFQEGIVIRPDGIPVKDTAVIWVHGFTGRFYDYSAINIGRRLAGAGYVFTAGNNRGHDFGSVYYSEKGSPLLYGGGWELFEESIADISAWIDFTAQTGFEKFVLIGHSLGALKVMFYQAKESDTRIAGLAAASPPLRGHNINTEILELAERMISDGRGRDLLPWNTIAVGAGTQSALGFIDFAKGSIKIIDDYIGKIRCPLLVFYGTNEGWIGDEKDLEIIKRSASASSRVDAFMLEGVDHSYNSHIKEVSETLIKWLDSIH